MSMTGLLTALEDVPLLPVLRVSSAEQALALTGRLTDAGLRVIEFTATTPGWADSLAAARSHWPQVVFGAGTVLTQADAERAVSAGAQFLVSPYPAPQVRPVAAEAGLAFLEGGFTPAEVADAASRGPAKLFPAHVGGPSYLSSLRAVLPQAKIVPTGGIGLADIGAWLTAGAFAVGVGSDLTAPGDIAERVQRVLAGVRAA